MDLISNVQSYLFSISSVVDSFSKMICCKEFENNAELLHKIVVTTLEFERSTADFIDAMELNSIAPKNVADSKRCFVNSNERMIKHLEKIQLQGFNFSELITSLKLEIDTLTKEINFL